VRNIYISQIENGHRVPGRHLLQKIAAATNTTVGFLLMETDDPSPVRGDTEPTPVYFSPEADEAARMIDDAPQEERPRIVAVVRVLVETSPAQEADAEMVDRLVSPLTRRLIEEDRPKQLRGERSF
jgi:transcriptional regulator with XRE-family HTH domain